MKYLEEHELEIGTSYICEIYDGALVCVYYIEEDYFELMYGRTPLRFEEIRYVLEKTEDFIKRFR